MKKRFSPVDLSALAPLLPPGLQPAVARSGKSGAESAPEKNQQNAEDHDLGSKPEPDSVALGD